MTPSFPPDDPELDTLVNHVLSWTGYRPDPIHTAAVRRAVGGYLRRGVTTAELLQRVVRLDPEALGSLLKAVSVPETYFFRQPEHFDWIADWGLARFGSARTVRAWSAGCATGEEAYSLAACLRATMPAGTDIEVLGTDIFENSLEIARAGVYGPWSQRLAGPILCPVCSPMERRQSKVLDELRAITRFHAHNLLGPPPGQFEIVFCRNVLLYFSTEAARTALEHIVVALAPEGVAIFGTLDVTGAPEGLTRVGRTELNIFVHQEAPKAKPPPRRMSTKPPRRMSTIPPPRGIAVPAQVTPEVAMHLRVLTAIERDDRRGAERELIELRRSAPDYLPGCFEYALLLVRHGRRESAVGPMRELLRQLEPLPLDQMLAGPEHLPVSYYQTAARAFLSTVGEELRDTVAGS